MQSKLVSLVFIAVYASTLVGSVPLEHRDFADSGHHNSSGFLGGLTGGLAGLTGSLKNLTGGFFGGSGNSNSTGSFNSTGTGYTGLADLIGDYRNSSKGFTGGSNCTGSFNGTGFYNGTGSGFGSHNDSGITPITVGASVGKRSPMGDASGDNGLGDDLEELTGDLGAGNLTGVTGSLTGGLTGSHSSGSSGSMGSPGIGLGGSDPSEVGTGSANVTISTEDHNEGSGDSGNGLGSLTEVLSNLTGVLSGLTGSEGSGSNAGSTFPVNTTVGDVDVGAGSE